MCYTISNNNKEEATLQKLLGPSYPRKTAKSKARYCVSGFTHPDWPVISADNPNEFQHFYWGLIPNWTPNSFQAKQFRVNNLNSKSETIFTKPSFAEPIKKQRCLIPVTGFFEWRSLNNKKYPYHIQLKNEEIFCLGGIYDEWTNKETGETIKTFSIVTTEANPLMEKIHNVKFRMPFILTMDKAKNWLLPNLSESDLKSMMLPLNENLMTAYTISHRITSKTENPNAPETLLPHCYPELELMDSLF